MTIALGILTHGGVVIAADTEIGVEYLKTGEGKISFSHELSPSYEATLTVTGSGNSGYLNHVQKDLTRFGVTDSPSKEAIQQYASGYITEFYAKHIIPFSNSGNQPPDIQIIMAHGSDKSSPTMWATENNVLTEYASYVAVGIGEMYARILMDKVFMTFWPMRSRNAILLAAYVVFHVKECIPGCGKETDIVCLRGGAPHFVGRAEVKTLEEIFRRYSQVEATLLHDIFNESEKRDIRMMSREVRKLRIETKKALYLPEQFE